MANHPFSLFRRQDVLDNEGVREDGGKRVIKIIQNYHAMLKVCLVLITLVCISGKDEVQNTTSCLF